MLAFIATFAIVTLVLVHLGGLGVPPVYPPVHPCAIVGAVTTQSGALVLIRECNDGTIIRDYPYPEPSPEPYPE